ncbi:hypothetical protein SEVIR_9G429400v4 [Setaria viridis]|uniref:Uncharacterized protein n=1 Tax=Setaria viridis TaxID=4556 RepID=A0A4U6T478_SETVI|nr:hypothetical protein SEVIR_9G429400v2 [Setaria viridis]
MPLRRQRSTTVSRQGRLGAAAYYVFTPVRWIDTGTRAAAAAAAAMMDISAGEHDDEADDAAVGRALARSEPRRSRTTGDGSSSQQAPAGGPRRGRTEKANWATGPAVV